MESRHHLDTARPYPLADKEREASALASQATRLLTVRDAARYLKVSASRFRNLVPVGTIPRVRVPIAGNSKDMRRILIDREDLDRLIESWKRGEGGVLK